MISLKAKIYRISIVFIIILSLSCRKSQRDNVVTLKFWHAWGGYEGKALEALVEEFNQTHPHIKVIPSFFVIGDKLLAAIAGGVPPDIATLWDSMLVDMGESGCFIPLEERMQQAGFTRDSFLPGIWEYGMFGKHRWGVPTTLNVLGIYYNKKFAREAGLDPDDPPDSISELEEWSQRLLRISPSESIERIGYIPNNTIIWFWNFGGDVYEPLTRRMVVDQPANRRALEWMARMYMRVGLENWRRFSAGFGAYQSPQNPFFVGKLAMREDGQWLIMFIRQFAPDLDYGIFAYPNAITGGPGYTYTSGSFWAIPVGTKHPDEAWEFLKWLISPKQNARFCAALFNIPPLKATLEEPAFKKVVDEKLQFFIDQLLQGRARPYPALPITNLIVDRIIQGAEVVYGRKKTAADFLLQTNAELQRELDRSFKFMGIK